MPRMPGWKPIGASIAVVLLGVVACGGSAVEDGTAEQNASVEPGAAPDTTIETGPAASTNEAVAHFTFSSSVGTSTFECKLDLGGFVPCPTPFSTIVSEGTHTIAVRAVLAGAVDPTPAKYTWKVDASPPDTTIESGPTPVETALSDVTFKFVSSERKSTFVCRIDQAGPEPCASGERYSQLSLGAHTFTVYAIDAAGNRDATPAEYPFTVTQVAPDTQASCPPPGAGPDDVRIAFESSVAGSKFRCSLDGGVESKCKSPMRYRGLDEGPHTFSVVAVAPNGTVDPSPAQCDFSVDATAPEVEITSPESGGNVGTTVTFTFSVTPSENGLSFDCTLGGDAVPCGDSGVVTLTNLPLGKTKFRVTVTDQSGNTTSDSVTVKVVGGPPVEITLQPFDGVSVASTGSAAFAVVGDHPAVAFACKLNGLDVPGCTSPIPWQGLPHGSELSVEVSATDTATGVTGPTAVRTAVVDAEGPSLAILAPAAGSVVSALVAIEVESDGLSLECALDGVPFECSPGVVQQVVLDDGDHELRAVAVDALGNAREDEVFFFVDATGPLIQVTQAPSAPVCPTSDDQTSIHFVADDRTSPSVFTCNLDGSEARDCTSGSNAGRFDWTSLELGAHELVIVAFDGFRNPGPRSASGTLGVAVPFEVIDCNP